MRQNRHSLFDMSYLECFRVLTGVRVDMFKERELFNEKRAGSESKNLIPLISASKQDWDLALLLLNF